MDACEDDIDDAMDLYGVGLVSKFWGLAANRNILLGARWASHPSPAASTWHARVLPARFDPESGRLELRPVSPAYATRIRLHRVDLIRRINTALGSSVVRTLRVLPRR